jgi:Flp pilus assembly protein TadD
MGSTLYSTAENKKDAASAITIKASESKKGGESGFAKIFKAPFRAFGKLFSRKNDSQTDQTAKVKINIEEKKKETPKEPVKVVPVVKVEPVKTSSKQETVKKDQKTNTLSASTGTFNKVALSPFLGGVSPHPASTAPTATGDYLVRGRQLLESGKINEAIAELSIAASVSTDIVEANNLLGAAYDRKGLYKEAQECYERVLRAVPNEPKALNNWGCSLFQQGKYREAISMLKKSSDRLNSPQILNNLALAQGRTGKYDDAFKTFSRAGGELHARLNVAMLQEQAGKYADALKHYEKAARLSPNSDNIKQRIANLNSILGKGDSKVVFTPLDTK